MAKKHVILFAGTTEGRILANWLDEQSGVTGIVCVATEYGAELLEEEMSLKHLTVHCGRLDEGAMEAFLKKESPSLVIDATHPYARVVTEQVAALCRELAISYQRILRGSETEKAAGQNSGMQEDRQDFAPVFVVDSVSEAAACLKQDGRPVLLTTGSKELEAFAGDPVLRERIFARVLPDSQVLKKCGSWPSRRPHHCHAGTVFGGTELCAAAYRAGRVACHKGSRKARRLCGENGGCKAVRRIRGRDPASSPRGRNLTGRGKETDGCVPDGQAAGKQRSRWHGQTFSQYDRHGHGRRKAAYPGSPGSAGAQ